MPCQIVLNLTMQAELNINSNKLLLFWYNSFCKLPCTFYTQSVFGKFHLTLKIDVQIISQLISQSQTCSTILIFKSSIIFICLICYFLILTDKELAEKQTKCLPKKKRRSTHEGRGSRLTKIITFQGPSKEHQLSIIILPMITFKVAGSSVGGTGAVLQSLYFNFLLKLR